MQRTLPALPALALLSLLLAVVSGSVIGALRPFAPAIRHAVEALDLGDRRWDAFSVTTRDGWSVTGFAWRMDPEARERLIRRHGANHGSHLLPVISLSGPQEVRHEAVAEVQVGFPFRSHAYLVGWLRTEQPELLNGSAIQVAGRAISFELVLPGFIANAGVAFLALVLLLLALPRGVHTAPRRWRPGLCGSILAALAASFLAGSVIAASCLPEDLETALPATPGHAGTQSTVQLGAIAPNPAFSFHSGWSWFIAASWSTVQSRGVISARSNMLVNWGRDPEPQELPLILVAQIRFGLPFASSAMLMSERYPFFAREQVEIAPDSVWRFGQRLVPRRVLAPGLLANAAIVFMLIGSIPGAFALRRQWRGRRQRCVRCGYQLHAHADRSVCPECGAAQPSG